MNQEPNIPASSARWWQGAINTVAEACQIARAVQRNLADVQRMTKDDRSPVTVADFAVQAIVHHGLARIDPIVPIVGEESATALREGAQSSVLDAVVKAVQQYEPAVDAEDVLDAIDACDHDASADAYWTLDPVDGTKGFLRGQQYAIALARIERGEVVMGVMGCPNLPLDQAGPLDVADSIGSIYVAARGCGAWELPGDNPAAKPRRIQAAREATGRVRTCESVESGHSKQSDTQRILERLGESGEPVRLDSQCKYAVVARGQADAYLRLPTSRSYVEKIWDHAAGMLIATEAGAVVTDVTGATLDFSRGTRLETNRGIVCATPRIHERIIAAIVELGIAAGV